MIWYHKTLGTHTHVRVFMNGANCGFLCFRKEEFDELKENSLQAFPNSPIYSFVDESEMPY